MSKNDYVEKDRKNKISDIYTYCSFLFCMTFKSLLKFFEETLIFILTTLESFDKNQLSYANQAFFL